MLILNVARVGARNLNPSVYLSRICSNCGLSAFSKLKTVKLYNSSVKPVHEVNTRVAKDMILFHFENPRYFKIMNIFACCQYAFWAYLSAFAYTSLRDAPVDPNTVDENTPWIHRINLGENKYKNSLAVFAMLIGGGMLALVWMFTLRSVRYLILHKGGKQITFVTYAPFGKNRMLKVPLEDICCKESRGNARVQLPLKVRNRRWHYILDMRGEFRNAPLFDYTAGLHRNF